MVLDKLRTDGVMPTLNAVRNKLDQPLPLGYCNAGVVVELGAGVTGFARRRPRRLQRQARRDGQRAGQPLRRIPDAVTDEQAAFTVVGAIALQGIRLAQPTLGEAVVVTGLGLIGQLVGAAAARQRLPRARHRPRSGEAGTGAKLRRRNRESGRWRGSDCGRRTVLTRSRRRRRDRHRRHQEQRADAPGRADVPQARAHRAGGRDRARACPGTTSSRRSCRSRSPARTGPAATIPATKRRGRTIRSATCAGPSSETSRRCSTRWPTAVWM